MKPKINYQVALLKLHERGWVRGAVGTVLSHVDDDHSLVEFRVKFTSEPVPPHSEEVCVANADLLELVYD